MSQSESKLVAAIIGVGPGLGASLARRFAAKYAVAINARTTDYLRTLASDIRGRGGTALEVQANVANIGEVHRPHRCALSKDFSRVIRASKQGHKAVWQLSRTIRQISDS